MTESMDPYVRSCKGVPSSNSSSGISSCSSSEASTKANMMCEGGPNSPEGGSTNLNSPPPEMLSPVMAEPRISLVFLPKTNPDDAVAGLELYQPFIDLVNSDVQILASANQNPLNRNSTQQLAGTLDMPTNALVLFLQEEEASKSGDRLALSMEYLSRAPWKFHHSEWVPTPRIQAYSHNSHDYFTPDTDLPLCSVRQIHCGEEHIRVVRFISVDHWQDSIQLYSQILGQEPDAQKPDFCIFTVEHHAHFDIQFSLKKLPKGVVPRPTKKFVLSFRVNEVGSLVALLPSQCYQISDTHWVTVDFDGNEIFLEQCNHPQSKMFMGKTFPTTLHSIAEDQSTPLRGNCFVDTEDESVCGIFQSMQSSDYHKLLTSTPVTEFSTHSYERSHYRTNPNQKAKRRIHKHQHTDSGFVEEKPERSSRSEIRSVLNQFCEVSLHEMLSSGDDKSEGSVQSRTAYSTDTPEPTEIDMTVRSAYPTSPRQYQVPCQANSLPHVAERLRPGHLHRGNKVTLAELDPKQSFTQLWVLNGHQEITCPLEVTTSDQERDERASISSFSSVETALSDPFSDRGVTLAAKTLERYKKELPPLGCQEKEGHLEDIHEEVIDVPNCARSNLKRTSYTHVNQNDNVGPIANGRNTCLVKPSHRPVTHSVNFPQDMKTLTNGRDSSSVTSSEGATKKKPKAKKVSFSATVQEQTISPRPLSSQEMAETQANKYKAMSELRKSKVQSIIDKIQSSNTTTPDSIQSSASTCTPRTPSKTSSARVEIGSASTPAKTDVDKSKMGFWI